MTPPTEHPPSPLPAVQEPTMPKPWVPPTEWAGPHAFQRPRPLSMPDLKKLSKEWECREELNATKLDPGKLQIDLLNVRSDVKVKRPVMRLRMGPQRYFSSRLKDIDGNWNEGFMFTVSYHNQLFDTIELDLFDKRKGWRSKTRHIGKAKLRLSLLRSREDVFLTFLPMYEYHARRYLPDHIQLPHNFLKTHIPKFRTQENLPQYHQHPSHHKHSMTPLIGSIQVRVRYTFQIPPDDQRQDSLTPVYTGNDPDTCSVSSSFLSHPVSVSSKSAYSESLTTASTATAASEREPGDNYTHDNDKQSVSTDAPSAEKGTDGFHVAVDPNAAFPDDLNKVSDRLKHRKQSSKPNTIRSESSVNLQFTTQLRNKLARRTPSTQRLPTDKDSLDAEAFGFSRKDMENRQPRRRNSSSSIRSNNFGDKNFAIRWINESFEEVALSHPSLDRMIGLVVSPQTRILLRAVVKMLTGFGQGFRITGFQLLSSLALLQTFYSDIPRLPLTAKIIDLPFLDKANHFLGHAIIAYGWRGLSYLGDYAKYLKDVIKTRSNKEAIVRYLKIPREDLLGYEYGLRKGAVFQPSYFVSIDRGYEAIVLGIRGTWSLYDCITDLVCQYRPWKGGLVHSGILASAQWLFTHIIPQIFSFVHRCANSPTRPISSFIIAGHSLGAGTAALLTMMVVDHLDELRRLSGNPSFQVHCYSYAPVAAVSLDLAEKYKDHIDSFVCQDDLVARLSYGSASCAKELIMDSLIAVDGLGGTSKVNTDNKIKKACFEIIQARRQEIFHSNEPRYPLLYVPGKVYQFRRREKRPSSKSKATRPRASFSFGSSKHQAKDLSSSASAPTLKHGRDKEEEEEEEEPEFTLHVSSPRISEEVLVSKTCLEDHMLVTYLNAFQASVKDCMRGLSKSQSPATDPSVPIIQIKDPDGRVVQ